MIVNNIAFDKYTLSKLLNSWVDNTSSKKKNKNPPVSYAIYQELLNIIRANGEKNTTCFRLLVNSDIKADSHMQLRLALIRLYYNNGKNYPYFLAGLMGVLLLPVVINRPSMITELSSLIFLFALWYIAWLVLMIFSFFVGAVLVTVLQHFTLIRHPHLLYLSLVIDDDGLPTSRIKILFKDNEGFYGKNNNYIVELEIDEDCNYPSKVTQNELVRMLKTIQYSQSVQIV
jgi:hypothetical protein